MCPRLMLPALAYVPDPNGETSWYWSEATAFVNCRTRLGHVVVNAASVITCTAVVRKQVVPKNGGKMNGCPRSFWTDERRCMESVTLRSMHCYFMGSPNPYVAWLRTRNELVTCVDLRRAFIRETDKNASV